MAKPHAYASHPAIIKRLKRADGHLRSVTDMIDAGKPGVDVARQLPAVKRAVVNAKRALIHDHLDHCLDEKQSPADRDELKTIARYL